jgi:hypothetical protein
MMIISESMVSSLSCAILVWNESSVLTNGKIRRKSTNKRVWPLRWDLKPAESRGQLLRLNDQYNWTKADFAQEDSASKPMSVSETADRVQYVGLHIVRYECLYLRGIMCCLLLEKYLQGTWEDPVSCLPLEFC